VSTNCTVTRRGLLVAPAADRPSAGTENISLERAHRVFDSAFCQHGTVSPLGTVERPSFRGIIHTATPPSDRLWSTGGREYNTR